MISNSIKNNNGRNRRRREIMGDLGKGNKCREIRLAMTS